MQTTWVIYPQETFFEPVINKSLLLAGSKSGVLAVDKLTGKKKWKITSDISLFTPVVDEQTAYIAGEDGSLRAVNLTYGDLLWQRSFPGWVYPPAVFRNVLITGGRHGVLWAVDRKTGEPRWELNLQGQELIYRPVVSGHTVFISLFNGHVFAINAADGKIIWKHDAHVASAIPVISDDTILLTGWNGMISALSVHNGDLKWQTTFSDHRFHPVTVTDNYLFVGDDFGEIFILNKRDGSIINRICTQQPAVSSALQFNNKTYLPVYSQQTGFKLLHIDITSKKNQSSCQ